MQSHKSKKITIGVFTYDFFPIFGGQGRHLYEIYKQNQLHKHVNMYIFSPNRNSLENHINIYPETKKSKFKNIEYSLKLNNNFERIIKKYDLDIVHIHGGPGGLFLFNKLTIPCIYTVHHTYWQQVNYIKEQVWKKFFYLLEKRSYKFADKIICVSSDTQKILIDRYHLPYEKTLVIPNGIDLQLFNRKRSETDEDKNILYVGRVDKRKGVDFLLRAMTHVNNVDPEITLYVVGEGKDRKRLQEYSESNNLPVIFLGSLQDSQLQAIYEKVSAQIVPSIFEGFGISVLEGMAKGVPIIATNVDGIRTIVDHNHTGIMVPYGDERKMAETITTLLNNTLLCKDLIYNAHQELYKYDWNNIYKRTTDLYENIVF